DFADPSGTVFDTTALKIDQQGALAAVDDAVRTKLFDGEAFRAKVVEAAEGRMTVLALFQDLMEPPPRPDEDAIPYLGDTEMFERLLQIVAQGAAALERGGRWFRREATDIDPTSTYTRIRGAV